jgi:hypothetical protein
MDLNEERGRIINIKEKSYPLPEKLKAELVKSKTAPELGADSAPTACEALETTSSAWADPKVGARLNHLHRRREFQMILNTGESHVTQLHRLVV